MRRGGRGGRRAREGQLLRRGNHDIAISMSIGEIDGRGSTRIEGRREQFNDPLLKREGARGWRGEREEETTPSTDDATDAGSNGHLAELKFREG